MRLSLFCMTGVAFECIMGSRNDIRKVHKEKGRKYVIHTTFMFFYCQ